ncbi:HNH endonuclease signature motif containing protein [Agreia pratensis]|uniref:HNH nuclease domain-containing protein n=1 Tax=Agreia pratensis TaxID=150121 RepID=A0A1X7JF12_9MICO|nr:HNH endonuclease signature motif containing protein [Agreia pratensis]SMG26347.1 protein of unknown function [Agreia pratensis]
MDLLDASLGDIAARLLELLEIDRAATAIGAISGDALLESAHDWEAIGRAGDAARTWVAAEIAYESRRELDTTGLAYQHGFSSAKKLLAASTNVSERTAATRIVLGQQLRSSVSLSGAPNPSFFPVVESAFFAGRVGVDAASVICRTLSEMVDRTGWSDTTEQAERHLVEAAAATVGSISHAVGGDAFERAPRLYTVEEIARLAIRIREHVDPDGAEPRDQIKQSLRGFSYPKVGADGMARGRYALPPLQLGVFLTAIDSVLSPRTPDHSESGTASRPAEEAEEDGGASSSTDVEAVVDTRTFEQKILDAVMSLIEMAAASSAVSRLNGAAPTVNVHVTLDDLASGRGVGWIDGSTEPIPISTVVQLQCDGDTVPTLFGQHGEVLNHGKTQRLATRRQRRALAARDGGCVMPGCTVPPSRCQAHHVIPWVSPRYLPGKTDLDNLALLCPFHHATIHTSAWTLVMINGKPHVKPPGWRDPGRTPRPAGHQRARRPW